MKNEALLKRAAYDEKQATRARAARALASSRGWCWSYGHGQTGDGTSRGFRLDVFAARRTHARSGYNPLYDNELIGNGRLLDHLDYFRESWRPYRPIAIVTHSYDTTGNFKEFAAQFGLVAERLRTSWYWPGRTVAVLFTHDPRAHRVTIGGRPTNGWYASKLPTEARANRYRLEGEPASVPERSL